MRALLPLIVLLCPAPALAGLEFCNETDERVSVAIGYDDGGTWVSEGWWVADPGACVTAVSGELAWRYVYWRATARSYDWEGSRYMFCTSPEAFTIRGDEDCAGRGYESAAFNEIDLGEATSYTLTLTATGAAPPMPGPDAPMTSGEADDAPGALGEPYAVAGLLSHCDYYDAGLGCTVLADGWSYVATSYDDTPEDTLVALDGLGVNVPITISGDMLGIDGREALVTIRDWTAEGSDAHAAARAALQGFWTSTEDPAYQLLVYGARFEEFYDQVPDLPALMLFGEGCPGYAGGGTAFVLASRDPDEERCMFVTRAGGDSLELTVAGVPRPLSFRRANE